jgi:hypothetical protein
MIHGLFRFLFFLLVVALAAFAAAYLIPAHLHGRYQTTFDQAFVRPTADAGGFAEWSAATSSALRAFDHERETRDWLLVTLFPGYRGELYRLEQDFRALSRGQLSLVRDMDGLFRANELLRRAWEEAVLGHARGRDLDPSRLAQDLAGLLQGQLADSTGVLARYLGLLGRQQEVRDQIRELDRRLQADRATFFQGFPGEGSEPAAARQGQAP